MKTAVRRILLMSALMSPSALFALGLGEIHLNSALNQPFDADIELVSATQEDLGALRAALANNETFAKYGLDRPAFLSDFTFRVFKGANGEDVLKVTSPRPVTEPFVTLLVEASWPRGRLLREYTVLLDPPVFAPTPSSAEAPVATPRSTSAAAPAPRPESLSSESPAPASEARAPRSVAATSPGIEPGSSYRVQPNDTLWEIASAANPGSRADVNRAMVSIFQNNPQAFEGNINVLRSGSVLKIPQSGEIAAISASAASAEVARQYQMWKEGAASSGSAAGGESSGRLRLVTPEQGTAAPSTSTSAPAVPPATDAQSAGLKARVGQLEAELAEAKRLLEVKNAELATLQGQQAQGQPAQGPAAGGEVAVTPPGTPGDVPVQAEPAAATPAVEPTAEPAKTEPAKAEPPKKKKKTPPRAAPEPSLFDRIAEYWWVLAALAAVIAAALLLPRLRRARGSSESDLEEALGRDLRAATRTTAAPARGNRDGDIVVEEKRPVDTAAPLTAPAVAEAPRRTVSIEDTLSGDGAASIEAGDPLAEADFHMAYGLYDQAADLVQLAIKREPRRRELKLKLLEIFFVWGNKDRFLELAREMSASRADAPAGEWDKVLIMGKQIASEDALFAGTPRAAAADLDMELHGGTGTFDIDLDSGSPTPTDIDLSGDGPKSADDAGLDFMLGEPHRGGDAASLAPTVETPQIRRRPGLDDTEEVPIESLGLDVGSALDDLDKFDDVFASAAPEPVEDTIENPLLRPRIDDTIERTVENPALRPKVDDTVEEDLLSSTNLMKMSEDLAADAPDSGSTAVYEIDDIASGMATVEATRLEVPGGMPGDYTLNEEAATMSEVGTKLDLARAYIDMGDPEGARSILEEVLHEGNASQKQEADRLMASLP